MGRPGEQVTINRARRRRQHRRGTRSRMPQPSRLCLGWKRRPMRHCIYPGHLRSYHVRAPRRAGARIARLFRPRSRSPSRPEPRARTRSSRPEERHCHDPGRTSPPLKNVTVSLPSRASSIDFAHREQGADAIIRGLRALFRLRVRVQHGAHEPPPPAEGSRRSSSCRTSSSATRARRW
jgi:hypothetical protein